MPDSPIVVGIVPGQSPLVLGNAAAFARDLGAPLVCVYVDVSTYMTGYLTNGYMVPLPIDTSLPDTEDQGFPPDLDAEIASALHGTGVTWSSRMRAGDPATELANAAEEEDARAILVGTREPGFLASIEEIVTGSVAAHLAHRQPRPVIVVPLAPRPRDSNGENHD